jgi:DNA polymerase
MSCFKCDLSITRTNLVLGTGDKTADVMLIGEAPGYYEDKQGFPFVGESGVYLRELLAENNQTTNDIFITNVVKCRPPKNREPNASEIAICVKYFLANEIPAINPIFIITLGKIATQTMFGTELFMKNYVDRYYKVGKRWILPVYHPSYILQNPNLKDYYKLSIKNVFTNIALLYNNYVLDIAANFNDKLKKPLF